MTRNSTPRTVYTQIFHKISEDIANGVYQKGDMIPTQNELAEAFGVSRVTVREAIKELCRRGILETIKGRGTFVVKSPQVFGSTERSHGLSSLKKYAGAGMGIGSRLINIEELSADEKLSNIFGVPRYTPLIHIVRVRLAEGRPAGYDDAYLVKRYVGNIDFYQEDLENGSLYNLLNTKANIYFDVIDEKFRAVGCPDNVARLLDILPDEPVLSIKRTSSDQLGRIIEYCENYQRSDIFYTHTQYSRKQQDSVSTLSCNKIMGCIYGAALGDMFGTMARAAGDREHYRALLEHALDEKRGFDGSLLSEEPAGVSGEFAIAYFVAEELAKCREGLNPGKISSALVTWNQYPEFMREGRTFPEKALMTMPAGLANPGNAGGAREFFARICEVVYPGEQDLEENMGLTSAFAEAMAGNDRLEAVLGVIRGAVKRQPRENPLLEALLRLLERKPEEFTEMMAEAAWLGREIRGLSVLAGAIAGAVYGMYMIPPGYVDFANDHCAFNLEKLPHDIAARYYSGL